MNNAIKFPENENTEDMAIIISDRKRPEFIAATQAVSDYLKTLPLTIEQNNALIELIIANMTEAEHGAFGVGVALGRAYGKSEGRG
jgi:hypothetical protein